MSTDQSTTRDTNAGDRGHPHPRRRGEALIRLDLVEMLGEQGYGCRPGGNGEQAVELAKELRPDVVIMDVKMPVLDGLSAAEQLHEAKVCPVIMLTAFSQTELVERAGTPVMAYIVKPFTADDLRPAIDIAHSRWLELTALEAEVADLGERLETRKLVDRAKGVLMTAAQLSEDAFRWIQKTAMDRRLGMKEVAEAVINGFPTRQAKASVSGRVTPVEVRRSRHGHRSGQEGDVAPGWL